MYKPKYFNEKEMRIDNKSPEDVKLNAYNLTEKTLDPLREAVKKPITVNSWYRSPAYNESVGGAKDSQHTKGEAVDLIIGGMSIEEIYALILKLNLPFDQLILEYGNGTTWIHISLKRVGTNRKEVLKAVKTKGVWNYKKVK